MVVIICLQCVDIELSKLLKIRKVREWQDHLEQETPNSNIFSISYVHFSLYIESIVFHFQPPLLTEWMLLLANVHCFGYSPNWTY